ncbi:MAG TPA: WGR domain-containing protein [Candidatus Limnocylindrales bacterium]|nr:WGR domain-containing protein [Candidatus Limnocylindrales bacterium]
MNAVMEAQDRVTLYYREGSSDKVYQAAIEPAGELFLVNFAYGRRGSTLSTGTKTSSPVDYDSAKKIFAKLVSGKKAKGYTEGEDGTPYQHSDKQSSGILPQLLNPIEEAKVERLLSDDDYCAQEKFDGRHILVRKQAAQIEGINKKGLVVGLPETLFQVINRYGADVVLDGESIGDTYHAFDLLVLDGVDIRAWPYRERLAALMNLLSGVQQTVIRFVDTAFTTEQKRTLLDRLRRDRKEGIVFKRLDAPYTPGRPNSGGSQLKHKFCATLSAVVAKVNRQRSVKLKLRNSAGWQTCGNVTIPANHDIPKAGMVVEVRYLYAFKASGVLYQPVYLGPRDDVEPAECRVSQLKYKAEESC